MHGYDTPPEIEEAGFKSEFDNCMKRAADLYERICRDLAMRGSVRRAVRLQDPLVHEDEPARKPLHMCELRTMPQGHPDYRFICQEMWRKIQEVHPTLAECRKIHGLAEISFGTVAVGDADGVLRSRGWKAKNGPNHKVRNSFRARWDPSGRVSESGLIHDDSKKAKETVQQPFSQVGTGSRRGRRCLGGGS